uniref:Ig-like domain-containing protein n=1 Tax=Gasterosteus aculeatus aculeatus TaxID=481459 RepID=A0AAQ4P079_GASAC
MGHTLFGALGLFSLNILLYCGHAQDALLHIEPNWSLLFIGEKVTFICDSREGNDTDWNYSFSRNDHFFTTNGTENRYKSSSLTRGDSGEYQCVADHKIRPVTRESNKVSLTVSDVPRLVLTVSPSWTSPGDSVTLTCSVGPPSPGWRFFWYKAVPEQPFISYYYTDELLAGGTTGTEQDSYILHGQTHTAGYVCRAGRGDPVFYTQYSDVKFVWSGGVNPAASLTVSPHRLQHFSTESLSLICEGNSTEWRVMRADEKGSVFPCYIRGEMTGSTCNTDATASSGVYWCESGTQISNAANITIHSGDVILVSPVRPVTEGHSVTLGCKLRTEKLLYNVDFYKNDKLIPNPARGELLISAVTKSDEGFYKCRGRKSPQGLETLTSAESWLSVKYVPRPVLTVSPSWTSPGDSVTLTCSVGPPSAGWRFFWYKAVPDLSRYYTYYTYELLAGGTTGTEQDSYILHGQTHTAGYVCRAGRGDPVFYTQFSRVKFVWSGGEFVQTFIFLHKGINVLFVLTLFVLCVSPNDVSSGVNPAASLTVSPHRLQHFSTESLSLICEGNSTEWRVKKADEDGKRSSCSKWGAMNGSTCNTDIRASSGVYWCESVTQSSNAANITIH